MQTEVINLKETKANVNIYKKLVFVCITFPLQDYSEKSTGISFYDALECRLFVSAPKTNINKSTFSAIHWISKTGNSNMV